MEKNVTTPGVVVAVQFVRPTARLYQGYIDYMVRDEAVRREHEGEFDAYVADYMDDDEKTAQRIQKSDKVSVSPKSLDTKYSALFNDNDELTAEDKTALQRQFQIAQEAGSPMWQQIISFDNEYLKEVGLLSKDNVLDEPALRRVVRTSMLAYRQKEKMTDTSVWAASVHYNTDNIHVHIALVEPTPTRRIMTYNGREEYRGTARQSSIDAMKSSVVNGISKFTPELTRMNEIIRENIVAGKRAQRLVLDPVLGKQYRNLIKKLPQNPATWQYNHHAMDNCRPALNQFIAQYLMLNHADDVADFEALLDKQEERFRRAYGDGADDRAARYRETKWNDLYSRLGNAILSEMRKDSKYLSLRSRLNMPKMPPAQKLSTDRLLRSSYQDLKRALRKSWSSIKNQREFEELSDYNDG